MSQASSQPLHLTVTTIFSNLLNLKPAKIKQSENQFVKYKGNKYFLSPYVSESQKTIVNLPTRNILSHTDGLELNSNNQLVYGSYGNMAPFSEVSVNSSVKSVF